VTTSSFNQTVTGIRSASRGNGLEQQRLVATLIRRRTSLATRPGQPAFRGIRFRGSIRARQAQAQAAGLHSAAYSWRGAGMT
jgi:hypothetical protein